MIEPMDSLASRKHEAVIFVGPSRTGKTVALIDCWNAHKVISHPADMGFYFPEKEAAEDYGKASLARTFENSPDLAKMLSPKANDATITTVKYRHGMLTRLLYPTSSKMARMTLGGVGFTEYDSIKRTIGMGEGSYFHLGKKRVQNAMSSGMTMAESSPKRPITDPRWKPKTPHEGPPTDGGISPLYNLGDRRWFYWQCKHCKGRFAVPPRPQFDEAGDGSDAVVVCPHCGGVHTHDEKRSLNLNGRWIPEWYLLESGDEVMQKIPDVFEFRSSWATFWLYGCAAAYQSWQSIAANHLAASREYERTGSEEMLKTALNTDQGLAYLPKAIGISRTLEDLLERQEDYDRRVMPDEARFVLAQVDVQQRKFVVSLIAVGVGDEYWIIDRYDLSTSQRVLPSGDKDLIDPGAYLEDWKYLHDTISNGIVRRADGTEFAVKMMAVDSGGKAGVTGRAYEFWRDCKQRGHGDFVMLTKGRDGDLSIPRVSVTYPEPNKAKNKGSRSHNRPANAVPLWMMNVTILKDEIDGILRRVDAQGPGFGFVHIPSWMPEAVLAELTAEVRTPKGWEKATQGAKNELWDQLVMVRAQCLKLGTQNWGENWEKCPKWAEKVEFSAGNPQKTRTYTGIDLSKFSRFQ
jgi:phage terminase large subunit GpA-like protein